VLTSAAAMALLLTPGRWEYLVWQMQARRISQVFLPDRRVLENS
jgi:hypothetical protein